MKPTSLTHVNSVIMYNKKNPLMIMSKNMNMSLAEFNGNLIEQCSSKDYKELRARIDKFMNCRYELQSTTKTKSSTGVVVNLDWYVYQDEQYLFQFVKIRV